MALPDRIWYALEYTATRSLRMASRGRHPLHRWWRNLCTQASIFRFPSQVFRLTRNFPSVRDGWKHLPLHLYVLLRGIEFEIKIITEE
mgnify:CR=1 FL=1